MSLSADPEGVEDRLGGRCDRVLGVVFVAGDADAPTDRAIKSLHRRLDRESEDSLQRGMPFPVDWDPFSRDWMTLREVYHYATQHFDFHHRQLTL